LKNFGHPTEHAVAHTEKKLQVVVIAEAGANRSYKFLKKFFYHLGTPEMELK
jgi:hypothetical protein